MRAPFSRPVVRASLRVRLATTPVLRPDHCVKQITVQNCKINFSPAKQTSPQPNKLLPSQINCFLARKNCFLGRLKCFLARKNCFLGQIKCSLARKNCLLGQIKCSLARKNCFLARNISFSKERTSSPQETLSASEKGPLLPAEKRLLDPEKTIPFPTGPLSLNRAGNTRIRLTRDFGRLAGEFSQLARGETGRQVREGQQLLWMGFASEPLFASPAKRTNRK